MLIGYARVSTTDQTSDLQVDALRHVGCERIFEDVASGVSATKKGLEEALSFARPGDTLVVWRLDRLGRSVAQLVTLVNQLKERDIEFQSLVEAIDTSTATGKFFFHIVAAFAELERNLIRERTKAGLLAARARGRVGGRPLAFDEKTFEMALRLHEANDLSVGELCERLGIAKRTFYRRLKAHKDQAKQSSSTPGAPT